MRHTPYSTTVMHLPLCEQPVERLQSDCSPGIIELIAAIVGGKRQLEIAQELLARFGVAGLYSASVDELASVRGLGKSRAVALKAALEWSRRMPLSVSNECYVRSVNDAAQILMAKMSYLEQEHFRVLYLNTRNRLLGAETLYIGSMNVSHIRVGEAFRNAVKRNCAAVIFAHNHPSGDPTPSPEDVEVTRRLVTAGNLLDIEVLDHLIIGQQRFVSMRERLGF